MIRILDEDTIEKIAAGEVVERPASVVKELLENSIDAGANKISISFNKGGKEYISISDDGEGMTEEDARLSILPHSTSKIKNIEDINRLKTLGFRGEALSSIAKVSIMEIHTKKEDGVYIKVRGGEIEEVLPKPRTLGTTVTVRNLFFNLPARKKFLKSEIVEGERIKRTVIALALAYPEIHFSLCHNQKRDFELHKGTVRERITALFGEEPLREMTFIDYENGGVTFSGYVSLPEYLKEGRRTEFLSVNRRPVKNALIRKAVKNAYGIPVREKMPSFILTLSISPEKIDVNIHPRKEEINFNDEHSIYSSIFYAVRQTLGIGEEKTIREREIEWGTEPSGFWQLHNSYIFAQTKRGVLIVDQHAAAERILYEKIMDRKATSQKVLFPIIIQLSPSEHELLKKIQKDLRRFGFEIEEFGEKTIRIISVSSFLKDITEDSFKDILYEVRDGKPFSNIALILACKGAIKAGEKLTPQEMNALIDELFATKNPYFCPHGRPTIIKWSLEELDRRFGR